MARILVMDDDSHVLEWIQDLLGREGHTVSVAVSGREGFEILRKNRIDVIVTDVLMPDMDGLEFIQTLRDLHSDIPMIAISAGGFIGAKTCLEVAELVGADVALEKPVDPKVLLAEVARLAATRHAPERT